MRQQSSSRSAKIIVNQRPFRNSVVAALVMLKAKVSNLVAERVKEIIVIVMMCAEECVRFSHQMFVGGNLFRANIEYGFIVADHVEEVGNTRRRSYINPAQMSACEEG